MNAEMLFREAIAIFRRRWLLLILPLLIGAPIAVGVARVLPPVYQSTAKIIVESQIISDDLARSTVAQSAQERIQLIRQRLLTRDILLEIATKHRVFAGRSDIRPTDSVDLMRGAITITGTSTGSRSDRRTTGIDIAVTSDTPRVAAAVANELVTRVLQQNAEQRTNRAVGTLNFFTDEVTRLDRELGEQASRITRFKSDNAAALPDSLTIRQGESGALRGRLETLAGQRAEIDGQLVAIREAARSGRTELLPQRVGTPIERELFQLRSNLLVQRVTLSESHPSIRQITARIAVLETLAAQQSGVEGGIEAETAALEKRRVEVDAQIAAAEERVAELSGSIARTPSVELALLELQRNYEALQGQYQTAVSRQAQAALGERLEVSQQAERFEVIEQAVTPNQPIAPKRGLIMIAGIGVSGMFGFGFAGLAELLNRSMRTVLDVERQLSIRPIVAIPRVLTRREVWWRRWWLRLVLLLAVATPTLGLVAIDRFYAPLPLVAERLMESTGLDGFFALVAARLGA